MPAASPAGPTRRDPRVLWLAALVLLAARVALGVLEEGHPPQRPELVSWVEPADAPEVSRRTGRPILYDFSAEWCAPCVRMQQEVFAQERAAEALGRLVVPVRVLDRMREDGRNSAIVDSLQRAHQVRAFPTLVVVGEDGRAIDRLQGYPGAQAVMTWLGVAAGKGLKERPAGLRIQFP